MNKPAIIILEDSFKSGLGGGQLVSLQVIETLRHDFELYVFDTAVPTRFNKQLQANHAVNYVAYYTALPHVGSGILLNKITEAFFMPFQILANTIIISNLIKKIQKQTHQILIYSTTKKTLFFAFGVSLIHSQVKYIHHLHSFENTQSLAFRFKQKLYTKAYVLISVSEFIYQSFKLKNNVLINNPVVTVSGVEPKSIENQSSIRVVTFSKLIPQKGVEWIMQSHQYLPESVKQKVYIDIYGDGVLWNYLKQFENEHVKLNGYCDDIKQVLKEQAHITVAASVIPESFGLQIVESFVFGVPVIATRIGSQGKLVRDYENGLLVPIKNARAIAEKISWLIEHPVEYHEISKNCIKHARAFGVEPFRKSVSKLFKKALAE